MVSIGEGTPTAKEASLEPLMKGGPARWTQTITTHGALGTGDGPYVVDTLTAPDDNPWKSWIRFGGIDFFPTASPRRCAPGAATCGSSAASTAASAR